uniref:ribonuclease H n=1 Tax=Latimeria chalumnae TaxID=7897 RepID=H3AL86_LATCH
VQRYKFNMCSRQAGEGVGALVAQLRGLSEHCNYGTTLEVMLHDRLVRGINEPMLDFDRALNIARGMELAAKNTMEVCARPRKGRQGAKASREVTKSCFRCGKHGHAPDKCRIKNKECFNCLKSGHIHRVGKKVASNGNPGRSSQAQPKVHHMLTEESDYQLFNLRSGESSPPLFMDLMLNSVNVKMEIDTGASVSVIGEDMFQGERSLNIKPTKSILRTFTGEQIPVMGTVDVKVEYARSRVYPYWWSKVTDQRFLDGTDYREFLWIGHKPMSEHASMEALIGKYPTLTEDSLGTLKGVKGHFQVDPEAKPRFFKPRSIPYMLHEKVNAELERLQKEGIIEPVEFADWAAPIVPVLTADRKTVRICGDFKTTVNRIAKVNSYPLPRIEDLYAKLSGGKKFTKLDLKNVYLQIELEEDSKKFVTINTQRGLFQYNHLSFGMSSAPAIFQWVVDNLLQGIPYICTYLDDIIVLGREQNLNQVLERLSKVGMWLNMDKCTFMEAEVTYLGYHINAEGLQPVAEKACAIARAPEPTNVHELGSYLGLLNYYRRFIPNLSTRLAPLYKLLNKNVHFTWGPVQAQAFQLSKGLLQSYEVLIHYDPNKELILSCEASS